MRRIFEEMQLLGGIILPHPYGIVIGGYSKIGQNCHIGQHVTIGGNMGKQKNGQTQPVIGNDCFICANSIVVGPITIGDNVIIGAEVWLFMTFRVMLLRLAIHVVSSNNGHPS